MLFTICLCIYCYTNLKPGSNLANFLLRVFAFSPIYGILKSLQLSGDLSELLLIHWFPVTLCILFTRDPCENCKFIKKIGLVQNMPSSSDYLQISCELLVTLGELFELSTALKIADSIVHNV